MTAFRCLAIVSIVIAVPSQLALAQNANPSARSQSAADREGSGADPMLDLPPLPENKATLVGGIVAKLDSVRDRMSLRTFGGPNMNVAFDIRTKVYRDGVPAHLTDLHPGDRAYVDTILNGNQVFAKSISISSKQNAGDARGQVVAFDAQRSVLTLREQISPNPLKFKVSRDTVVTSNHQPASLADLRPGSLVEVGFAAGPEKLDEIRQINVLAAPGATFTFAGRVTFVDMRLKKIAIANRSDNETYDISLDAMPSALVRDLREGVEATVHAAFDGKGYKAQSIDVASSAKREE
jgi:hypothetical protein